MGRSWGLGAAWGGLGQGLGGGAVWGKNPSGGAGKKAAKSPRERGREGPKGGLPRG